MTYTAYPKNSRAFQEALTLCFQHITYPNSVASIEREMQHFLPGLLEEFKSKAEEYKYRAGTEEEIPYSVVCPLDPKEARLFELWTVANIWKEYNRQEQEMDRQAYYDISPRRQALSPD